MDRSIGRGIALGLFGLRHGLAVAGLGVASVLSTAPLQAQQMCGGATYPFPYTDVSGVGAPFCPGIMEAYVTGVSKGTTPSTFSPNNTVTRVQMTTFLQRSLDQGLARTSRRAALNQWWTAQNAGAIQVINVGGGPFVCAADGADIWVTVGSQVAQVEANTGKVLGTWTGASFSAGIMAAAGAVYVLGDTTPGSLYVIDPTQPPGAVTVANNSLGNTLLGIAFDGAHLWIANLGAPGSVIIIDPKAPYSATTVTAGFNQPYGVVYDGAHIWVTDRGAGTLLKLKADGTILQTVPVGSEPESPVFDGENIWVPNFNSNSITVVQASSGNVVATINADGNNMLAGPQGASFDGERVLIANESGSTVTLFKAADLSFIANIPTTGASPTGPCSDGINFWVNTDMLLRY
jgi:hypothetical protein